MCEGFQAQSSGMVAGHVDTRASTLLAWLRMERRSGIGGGNERSKFLRMGLAKALRSLRGAEREVRRLAAFSKAEGRRESRSAEVLPKGAEVCIQCST